jgi:hypothetical protein
LPRLRSGQIASPRATSPGDAAQHATISSDVKTAFSIVPPWNTNELDSPTECHSHT